MNKLKGCLGVFVVFAFLIGGCSLLFGGGNDNKQSSQSVPAQTQEVGGDSKSEPVKQDVKQEDSIPREYRNALSKAELYSNEMHMSKRGLYDQLTSEYGERFSPEAAQYAIDNVQANWEYNALKKAELYANEMHMSDQAIYDQLISEYGEKFTEEEADYALAHLK